MTEQIFSLLSGSAQAGARPERTLHGPGFFLHSPHPLHTHHPPQSLPPTSPSPNPPTPSSATPQNSRPHANCFSAREEPAIERLPVVLLVFTAGLSGQATHRVNIVVCKSESIPQADRAFCAGDSGGINYVNGSVGALRSNNKATIAGNTGSEKTLIRAPFNRTRPKAWQVKRKRRVARGCRVKMPRPQWLL